MLFIRMKYLRKRFHFSLGNRELSFGNTKVFRSSDSFGTIRIKNLFADRTA